MTEPETAEPETAEPEQGSTTTDEEFTPVEGDAAERALSEARVWARREHGVGRRTLPANVIETIFRLDGQAKAVAAWAKANRVRRVAIADFGKNLFATYRACREAGVQVVALADGLTLQLLVTGAPFDAEQVSAAFARVLPGGGASSHGGGRTG